MCDDFECPYITLYGNCSVTACIKPIFQNQVTYDTHTMIIFPQTIGNITFYSEQELVNWVISQKKMNKDTDYGVGRYS